MRKILFLLSYGLCAATMARSQQLSPSVMPADGGISKAAGISLEWTLGETTIESRSTTDRLYTQGFHQPLLLAKSFQTNVEQMLTGYHVTVAPNPVQSTLTASISSPNDEKVFLTLVDMMGRRFSAQSVSGKISTAKIDMSAMIAGIYLLEARNAGGQLIQSFKIIKAE